MIVFPAVLMAIANEEDSAFIRTLYLKNEHAMFITALRIVKDEHTANDMVSTACVLMVEKIKRLRKINSCKLDQYVIKIVRNTSLMYLRRRKREKLWLVDDETVFDWANQEYHELDEALIAEANITEVREALRRIHKSHRELLEMKYFEYLPDEEIAEQLNISKDSVRSYLTKARRSLRDTLKGSEKD